MVEVIAVQHMSHNGMFSGSEFLMIHSIASQPCREPKHNGERHWIKQRYTTRFPKVKLESKWRSGPRRLFYYTLLSVRLSFSSPIVHLILSELCVEHTFWSESWTESNALFTIILLGSVALAEADYMLGTFSNKGTWVYMSSVISMIQSVRFRNYKTVRFWKCTQLHLNISTCLPW